MNKAFKIIRFLYLQNVRNYTFFVFTKTFKIILFANANTFKNVSKLCVFCIYKTFKIIRFGNVNTFNNVPKLCVFVNS